MRSVYQHRHGSGLISKVTLTDQGGGAWHIDMVHVPPAMRGRGWARRLLARVLSDADQAGVRLSLEARACGGPGQADLVKFYRSLGFRLTGAHGAFGPVMRRACKNPSPACV